MYKPFQEREIKIWDELEVKNTVYIKFQVLWKMQKKKMIWYAEKEINRYYPRDFVIITGNYTGESRTPLSVSFALRVFPEKKKKTKIKTRLPRGVGEGSPEQIG